MSVRIRRKHGKWFVFINHNGERKSRLVGTSREAAERVRREIESRLALGTFGLDDKPSSPAFADYAERWLASHVRPHLKRSTIESYEVILDRHLLPRLGSLRLDAVTRRTVKDHLAQLVSEGKLARNTIKNIFAILRALFSQAMEDGLVQSNTALRLGRFNRPQAEDRKAEFLTREESEGFLAAAMALRPDRYPLFLAALRTGLRLGELLALRWDDIQFGESEGDSNRYILVRNNFTRGEFTSPKNRKTRRVDLNRELRQKLIELRDARMMDGFARGDENIGELVLPFADGRPARFTQCVPSRFSAVPQGGRLAAGHFPCFSAHLRESADSGRSESGLRQRANGAQLNSGDGGCVRSSDSGRQYRVG
ncbi:MAG TPA: phage integrase SAM-like domain-containing protein [Terriglobia bacterium]|nr:phage integrase SAM-like domain-containing protein [Terriglobia bacterium]